MWQVQGSREEVFTSYSCKPAPSYREKRADLWDYTMIEVTVEFISRSESKNTVTVVGCVNTVDTEGS